MSAIIKLAGNEVALANLAAEICTEHEAVRTAAETATHHAIQCGQLLTRAKDGLVHGEWLPWLQEHCHLSERTAQAYMRLARKHGELDGPKAQRVADLPVREAMRAIADERTETSLPTPSHDDDSLSMEELWEWSCRQINGPFNAFDLENASCLQDKLLRQTKVPAIAAVCLQGCDDDNPLLRCVPWGEMDATFKALVPIAKGNMGSLDIDFAALDTHAHHIVGVLELEAQRLLGGLLKEMAYREKTQRAGDGTAEWAAWQREGLQVAEAWLANIEVKRAKLFEEARGNGAA